MHIELNRLYLGDEGLIFIEMTWNISSPGQSSLEYSCEQIYMGALMFRIQTLEVHGLGLHVRCFDSMAISACTKYLYWVWRKCVGDIIGTNHQASSKTGL